MLKPFRAAVVRVRHFVIQSRASILKKQTQALPMHRRAELFQHLEMTTIHRQDQVEGMKIFATHTPRSLA